MRLQLTFLLFVMIISTAFAQEQASNVLKFTEGMNSPKASLQDVSWISGYWRGEAFGGITEEIWSDPLGNSMMFSFKLVINGKIQFYEVGGITEENNTLLLQLKHFHGDFKGWEKKDETVDFKLVKVEKDRVYFDEFTFEKISDSEINLYVVVHNKDGSSEEVKFNYKRR
ncbi:DUF6265 family protein [Aquimarina spongiae]|uniref:DUF6265 domain-containing protein n=1 Tax=Aquimarina spongiae TaxID=570521 RepID=A0A1M6JTA8_9FLAO|nr:DUF6265 family protein [Aquimarina spongiae]SHJ49903.1 hypothetical protein SAMN04488508_109236 [Aquimarina spongiae]